MMRHVLFAPLLMSAVLLVSACGGDDGDEPSPPGSGGEVGGRPLPEGRRCGRVQLRLLVL